MFVVIIQLQRAVPYVYSTLSIVQYNVDNVLYNVHVQYSIYCTVRSVMYIVQYSTVLYSTVSVVTC